MSTPALVVLAGPNGAGKSTLYHTVVAPQVKAPFINADIIQRDELKDPSMEASYKAAAIAQGRRDEALRRASSFVTETTFSHPSKLQLIHDAREAGFYVVLYHVGVDRVELSVTRVAQRVHEGEHNVPEDKIRERFERNQPLIRSAVLSADIGFVYDNSSFNCAPERVILFRNGVVMDRARRMPAWAATLYAPELSTKVVKHTRPRPVR
ncbi:MAG: zeta toxin family protein [Alphaproteobacteria bacterium]|nr:zeta toxin family protein [Alphaproteobacteria bacterium]